MNTITNVKLPAYLLILRNSNLLPYRNETATIVLADKESQTPSCKRATKQRAAVVIH